MFNLFKKKPKIPIEEKVDNLNKKYKDYLNCYCMLGNIFMVWEGFIHDDNKIYIISKSMNNFFEQNFIEYGWLQFMYDEDFIIKSRKNFIILKENLEKVNLKIIKKE